MTDRGCERFRDELGDYLYGGLTPSEHSAAERHLAGCSQCRAELEATRQALAMVDRAGLASAGADVAGSVTEGVVAALGQQRRATRRTWLRAAASVAACLTLAAVGTWAVLRDGSGAANRQLEAEASAVGADAESVLRLVDELERENDELLRLMGEGGPES